MKRRNFLQQAAAASFLPLSGWEPRLDLFDHQKAMIAEAERMHDRVMAAFDFGASLPADPWTTNFCGIDTDPAGMPEHLAWLQQKVKELKRGHDYIVRTEFVVTRHGSPRVRVDARHFGHRKMPKPSFVARVEVDGGWRCGSWRHLA